MFLDKLTPMAERIANSRVASPVIVKAKPRRVGGVFDLVRPYIEEARQIFPRLLTPQEMPFSPYPIKVIQRFNMLATYLPREVIFRLAESGNVERIFYDAPMYAFGFPTLPGEGVFTAPAKLRKITFTTTLWTKKLLGCDVANKKGYFGREVLVSSVDTGASRTHEQIRRVRFKTTMKQFRDENGHGSHITSTIGGIRGVDEYLSSRTRRTVVCEGMAPECDLLAIKSLGWVQGIGSTSDIIDAVDISITERADVVNMSLGGDSEAESVEDDPYFTVFEEAVKNNMILCVAVGNSGPKEGTVGTPGSMPNALSVGAFDPFNGEIARFSSRGPTSFGDVKPDVMAPGVGIDSGITGVLDKSTDGVPSRYSPLDGTSMACPHIAGLVALAREAYKRKLGRTLTVDEIKRMLSELVGSKNNDIGWGLMTWSHFEDWVQSEYGVAL